MKTIKKIFLLFLMMLFGISAFSQSYLTPTSTEWKNRDSLLIPVKPPNIFIKTNPFSIIEPDAALTLAVEYRKDLRKAYQLEIGYIFLNLNRLGDGTIGTRGFRIKPEWRHYTKGRTYWKANYANYLAVEGIIKAVYNRYHGFVGRHCNGNNCAYSQQLRYRSSRTVLGLGGKIGREFYLGLGNNRLIMDIYTGIGVRYRWHDNTLPPDSNPQRNLGVFFVSDGVNSDMFLPYLSAGIKIGWRIK